MRVSINSHIASLVVDLKEEQVLELMREVLDRVSGKEVESAPVQEVVPKIQAPVIKAIPHAPAPAEPVREVIPDTSTQRASYKGFLYIECEKCGQFKAFMPKTPISANICGCGHKTELRDLKEMYVDCSCCGKSFKYMTNANTSVIAIDCLSCGAPVDLEYHSHKDNYQTIK